MLSGRCVNIDDDGCTLFTILFNLRKRILLCNCEFENVEMKSAPGKEAMFLMRFFNAAIRNENPPDHLPGGFSLVAAAKIVASCSE